jgi:2-keto-4-pentenoate hydratase/2-oxohepta-3-ene-1,7-dioic acid hydratase in catechol pathway
MQVTADNWTSFVAGLVVTNDVSARDVQLPKTQFFESKSYPTFTPVGPSLVLLGDDELKRFGDLRLRLWVNGALRQDSVVDDDMIYSPLEALQALSRFQRLDAGDLLLTGTTPVGSAGLKLSRRELTAVRLFRRGTAVGWWARSLVVASGSALCRVRR